MKKKILVIFICFFLPQLTIAQNICSDKQGNFRFTIPDGWASVKLQNTPYQIAAGITIEGFTQNIIVEREEFNGSLQEYLEKAKTLLADQNENIQITKEEDFSTSRNLKGIKLILENVVETGIAIKQYVYLFKVDFVCFIVSCSVLADEPEEIEEIFDTSMKTFSTLHIEILPNTHKEQTANPNLKNEQKVKNQLQ